VIHPGRIRGRIRDSGAVEKPHFGVKSKPDAETAVRNIRSSVTCAGVILSVSLMERGNALFQQPHSYLLRSDVKVRRGSYIVASYIVVRSQTSGA